MNETFDSELIDELIRNPPLFARTFLPHIFPGPIPWFHRAIFAILTREVSFLDDDPELDLILEHFISLDGSPIFTKTPTGVKLNIGRYTAIIMPRGYSKTMIAGLAVPLYDTVFGLSPFTLYLSHAGDHAEQQLDNIKSELSGNAELIGTFGEFKPARTDDARWASDVFETTHGDVFFGRGKNSQIRGLNHKGRRPNKIVVDDFEDDESVSTPAQRKKMRYLTYARVMPALAEFNPDSTMTVIGTKLHEESLLMTLSRDPQFTTIMLDAILPDGTALWPEIMPLEKIEEKRRSAQLAGELGAFYNEYLPSQRAPADIRIFDLDRIERQSAPPRENYMVAIAVDPAISSARTADEAVIKVIGLSFSGKIYHLDSWAARGANPSLIVDKIFELALKWGAGEYPIRVGIESNAFQVALYHAVEEQFHRRQVFFDLVKVMHKTQKEVRIKGAIAPRLNNGNIIFTFEDRDLIEQLTDFPYGKHDDHADAFAMALGLLDEYIGLAGGEHYYQREVGGESNQYRRLRNRACP